MQPTLLFFSALIFPSFCVADLGLGGLAPAPSQAAVALDVNVPTDLCKSQFCLAAVPAACNGNCILTPLNNVTEYCSLKCISVWDSATVKGCLADKAAGTYIQSSLTAISNKCNAGKIAAARRKAALAKYNTKFPCTKTVNATAVIGLDSCLTGTNATATNCPQACSDALLAVPPVCRVTFPKQSPPWAATLTSCIQGNAAAPAAAASASSVPGSIESTPSGLGAAFAPASAVAPPKGSAAPKAFEISLRTSMLAAGAAVVAVWLRQ